MTATRMMRAGTTRAVRIRMRMSIMRMRTGRRRNDSGREGRRGREDLVRVCRTPCVEGLLICSTE